MHIQRVKTRLHLVYNNRISNSNGGGITQGYNCCNYSSHRKVLENPKYGNE